MISPAEPGRPQSTLRDCRSHAEWDDEEEDMPPLRNRHACQERRSIRQWRDEQADAWIRDRSRKRFSGRARALRCQQEQRGA